MNLTDIINILKTVTAHGRTDNLTIADLEAYRIAEQDWANLATQVNARVRGEVASHRDLARSYLTQIWKDA